MIDVFIVADSEIGILIRHPGSAFLTRATECPYTWSLHDINVPSSLCSSLLTDIVIADDKLHALYHVN